MKIVFVGPSLPNAGDLVSTDIQIRPPACQGDVMQAISDGAQAIGIIDGQFGHAAPVWHKEILFALSRGIPVFGAASMGALRASECVSFGMIGIGAIFDDYVSGRRDDDADVALIYGPAELGYPALSIPMVNIEATLVKIAEASLLSEKLCDDIHRVARGMFFKHRTWKNIADQIDIDFSELRFALQSSWTDQKRLDAEALLKVMQEKIQPVSVIEWPFNATPVFRKLYM